MEIFHRVSHCSVLLLWQVLCMVWDFQFLPRQNYGFVKHKLSECFKKQHGILILQNIWQYQVKKVLYLALIVWIKRTFNVFSWNLCIKFCLNVGKLCHSGHKSQAIMQWMRPLMLFQVVVLVWMCYQRGLGGGEGVTVIRTHVLTSLFVCVFLCFCLSKAVRRCSF